MLNFRKIVKKRMAELNITTSYQLHQKINADGQKMTLPPIHAWLTGGGSITSVKLELVLKVLGADSVRFKKPKKK